MLLVPDQIFSETTLVPLQIPTPKKPAISIVGLGYVGAVSTACLAQLGHPIVGVDTDRRKRSQIGKGKSPIHEKGLGTLLAQGVKAGLVRTTGDLVKAVRETDITFVSVGTPTGKNGGCDDSCIRAAAHAIGRGLRGKNRFHVVVLRCSIPPGLTMQIFEPILSAISGKTCGEGYGLCFNPEFLREGVAIEDFNTPARTVIGATDIRSAKILAKVFEPVDNQPIITSIETAEMVKYIDNVWHATKVCFANEVGRLCKALHVDSHDVMDIFVQDAKLNLSPYYLKPGFAYGGSCLPKEVRAVEHLARANGIQLPMISSLAPSNEAHKAAATRMLRDTGARRVAVLGLAFKAGTDDLRESPILDVMAALDAEGIELRAHDRALLAEGNKPLPAAMIDGAPQQLRPVMKKLSAMLVEDLEDLLDWADAVIVTHDDPDYKSALIHRQDMPVIDVVRVLNPGTGSELHQGIGW